MAIYSQRDPQWKSVKLGFSNTTIGGYGCTISSLANLMKCYNKRRSPLTVNSKLRTVKGFANGNLIIWAKIKKAFPDFEWKYRGYKYEKQIVEKNLPCLIEVKAPPPYYKHWVLQVNKTRVYDPYLFPGKDRPLSNFTPTGYSIIKYMKPMPEKNDLEKCLEQHEKLIDKIKQLEKEIENEKQKTDKCEKKRDRYREERNNSREEVAEFKKTVVEQKEVIATYKANKDEYQCFLDKIKVKVQVSTNEEILASINTLVASESEYKKVIDKLNDDISSKDSLISSMEISHENEIKQLKADLEVLRKRLEKVEANNETIEKEKTNLNILRKLADIFNNIFKKKAS